MAAQQVDAQALVNAANSLRDPVTGGSGNSNQQSVRSKTTLSKKTPITKKTRPRRKVAKRARRDRSISEESRLESVNNNESLNSEAPLQIPCRAGCSMMFSNISDADEHVRAIHAAPRVDSINPLSSLATRNPEHTAQPESHSVQLSPEPISPNQCDVCQQFFPSATILSTHKSRKHNASTLSSLIPMCAAIFYDQQSLIAHILDSH